MTSPRFDSAYFVPDGDTFVPTANARGPWGQTVSGNYVGGLLGHVAERDHPGDDGMHPARLTVDLLRPVAMAPLKARSRVVRQGRRLCLLDTELVQGETVVARAGALFLRRGTQPPDDAWTASVHMPPLPPEPDDAGGRTLLMWVYGPDTEDPKPAAGFDQWQHDGPKSVWLRDVTPLVAGHALTPFTRAAIAGDVASSLTGFGSGGLPFINADYALSLTRLPDGPYLGLTALTHYSADGISTGTAAVFDRHGPIGNATATALANPGFAPPQR